MPFDHAVPNADTLRELYRQPHELVLRKQIDHVDDAARAFVEASPFVVVATHGPAGADASPRGGAAGFVAVLDQGRLAMGDLAGNNRLDTYTNLLTHPQVGLLFRSAIWEPSTWPVPQHRPSAARALRDHVGLEAPPEVIDADLEAGYRATMWEPGG